MRNFNPQGIKKHLEDAVGFCKFPQKQDISEIARNLVRFEQKKFEFFGYRKKFTVCLLNYHTRKILSQNLSLKDESQEEKPYAFGLESEINTEIFISERKRGDFFTFVRFSVK